MSIPIVLVGTHEQLAAAASKYLQPEFEVVDFIASTEEGAAKLPAILQGNAVPTENPIGTKNYANGVKAIIVGGTIDNAPFETLRGVAAEFSSIPWGKYDTSKPQPTIDPQGGAQVIARIKEAFAGADFSKDSIIHY